MDDPKVYEPSAAEGKRDHFHRGPAWAAGGCVGPNALGWGWIPSGKQSVEAVGPDLPQTPLLAAELIYLLQPKRSLGCREQLCREVLKLLSCSGC